MRLQIVDGPEDADMPKLEQGEPCLKQAELYDAQRQISADRMDPVQMQHIGLLTGKRREEKSKWVGNHPHRNTLFS